MPSQIGLNLDHSWPVGTRKRQRKVYKNLKRKLAAKAQMYSDYRIQYATCVKNLGVKNFRPSFFSALRIYS